MPKKTMALFCSIVMTLLSPVPASANSGGVPDNFDSLSWGVSIEEPALRNTYINSSPVTQPPSGAGFAKICGQVIDLLDCKTPESRAIMPACSSPLDVFCIEGVSGGVASTSVGPLQLQRQLQGLRYEDKSNLVGIPMSGTASIWVDSSGNKFLVAASVRFQVRSFGKPAVGYSNLTVSVVPVIEVPCPGCRAPAVQGAGPNWGWAGQGLAVEDQLSLQEVQASEGFLATVLLRLPSDFHGGFFFGRMSKPDVSRKVFGSHAVWTFSGYSATVPQISIKKLGSEYSPKMQAWFREKLKTDCLEIGWCDNSRGVSYRLSDSDWKSATVLEALKGELSDSATGQQSIWKIEQLSSGQSCYGKEPIAGVMSTNAMVYSGREPAYEAGFMRFSAAGLHYLADNSTVNEGSYDLAMKSSVARCLYGFSNAPISYAFSVLNSLGDQKISTTSLTERDGVLRFRSVGFTFSQAKISLSLSQPSSLTLTSFQGTAIALSSKQKSEVTSYLKSGKGNRNLTCTAFYGPGQSRSLALKRASSVCAFAKSLDRSRNYTPASKLSSGKSSQNKVILYSR